MPENRVRRDQLRDAAIEVLAAQGGRGLTHRAVDRSAGVPLGTAKNYFPTRDALLKGIAERCVELYWAELAGAEPPSPAPGAAGRDRLAAALAVQVARGINQNRSRLLAYQELHAEAARRPWLQRTLGEQARADFAAHAALHRASGLPVTQRSAMLTTLCINGALVNLLTDPPDTLDAIGLGDLDAFLRDLFAAIYPDP